MNASIRQLSPFLPAVRAAATSFGSPDSVLHMAFRSPACTPRGCPGYLRSRSSTASANAAISTLPLNTSTNSPRTPISHPKSARCSTSSAGQTLQQAGSASRVPDDRNKFFADSEVALQKFISERPQHPLAARANSLLGELLFDRSESLIWAASEKTAAEERAPWQNEARTLVDLRQSHLPDGP
ncbi:MAG UNVERIFIED_CONTAM: hypothetical protein LVR18_32105 [Planctomycetaceae bacterium]